MSFSVLLGWGPSTSATEYPSTVIGLIAFIALMRHVKKVYRRGGGPPLS
jgi:hypothetical protein